MKKPFYKKWWFITIIAIYALSMVGYLMSDDDTEEDEKVETSAPIVEEKEIADDLATEEESEVKTNEISETQVETTTSNKLDYQIEAEANTELYPAKPGAMLYDKKESKFKGMNYYFKGTLVEVKNVEGLLGNLENALLVKNEQGYVMPIFPNYEIDVSPGDEIEVWGPLSGDGYASSDLGVDNVVGVTGAINATRIDVNGVMQ